MQEVNELTKKSRCCLVKRWKLLRPLENEWTDIIPTVGIFAKSNPTILVKSKQVKNRWNNTARKWKTPPVDRILGK